MSARTIYVSAILASLSLLPAGPSFAANTLVITAPANGTTVSPGQVITVNVTTTGTYPNGVAIIGGSPTVHSQGLQTGANPTFSITIPATAAAGPFGISAVGSTSAGALVQSAEISLDVERPDMPQSVRVEPPNVNLRFIGDSLSVDVLGTFSDASKQLLTNSSQLQVSPANSQVAIFQNGLIIAAGPGSTNVTFTVGTASQSVLVTVPNNAAGDLNSDGRVDQSDIDILNAALNTPAMVANDARDLDHDGQITTADRTLLQGMCTVQRPKCATH